VVRAALLAVALAAALVACAERRDAGWSGYVEGDFVYVASPLGGSLQALAVRRGQSVARGAPLFSLESEAEQAAREEAAARLAAAEAQAREDERQAAQAAADASRQALRQTDWRMQQKALTAPADALVADTFFRPGEWVQPGQPVVALLPPDAVRVRFFVPQGELPTIAAGQPVEVRCDGCGPPIAARIDFIASQAEYTPPVIYSNAQRARLVFMAEARPADPKDAARLRPGQPVDVRRAGDPR
ncbi:MAG TPA: HlyD family secretion protein, partial [Albitalea sp.]